MFTCLIYKYIFFFISIGIRIRIFFSAEPDPGKKMLDPHPWKGIYPFPFNPPISAKMTLPFSVFFANCSKEQVSPYFSFLQLFKRQYSSKVHFTPETMGAKWLTWPWDWSPPRAPGTHQCSRAPRRRQPSGSCPAPRSVRRPCTRLAGPNRPTITYAQLRYTYCKENVAHFRSIF